MARLRHWLLVSIALAVGCGGQEPDDGQPDGGSGAVDVNRDNDAARDGVGFSDGDAIRAEGASLDVADANFVERHDDAIDALAPTNDATADTLAPPDGNTREGGVDVHDAGVTDVSVDRSDNDASVDNRDDAADDGADDGGGADIHADGNDLSVDRDVSVGPDAADAAHEHATGDGAGAEASTDAPSSDAPSSDAEAGVDGCTPAACNLVALSVTPYSPHVGSRMTQRMKAFGSYLDGTAREVTTDVRWSTDQPFVAVISNVPGRQGLLTAVNGGQATITASLGAVSASTIVSTGINEPRRTEIRPPVPSIALGTQMKLEAIVTFNDGTQGYFLPPGTWTSNAPAVATVDAEGVVHGVALGTTTITAGQSWYMDSTTVTVTSAILSSLSISPATMSLPIGLTHALRMTGHFSDGSTQDLTPFAAWGSSDPTRVSVDDIDTKGKITAAAVGNATITATYGGTSASAVINVNAAVLQSFSTLHPPHGRLMLNMQMRMFCQGNYSDGSTHDITDFVTWSSRDPSIVEASGQYISARDEGATEVVGTSAGIQQNLSLEVRAGILQSVAITPNPAAVARGASTYLSAVGTYDDGTTYDLTWFSGWSADNRTVAWVHGSMGSLARLRGVAPGTTNVWAAWAGVGGSGVANVTVMATPHP